MFEKLHYFNPHPDLKSGASILSIEERNLLERTHIGVKLGLKGKQLLQFVLDDIAKRLSHYESDDKKPDRTA